MKAELDRFDPRLRALETRESQLWWLAVFVIVLLGCAVSAVDWTSTLGIGSNHPLSITLNTKFMRIGLVLAVLATSSYFRDTARRLRRANTKLIAELRERTEELQRKNSEIERLKDLSDRLISLTDLRKALDLALDMALEVIGADTASIMLLDRDSNCLKVAAARGLSEEVVKNTTVKLGDALSGMVAETGEALILNSDDLEQQLKGRAHRVQDLVSALIVPIRVDLEIRGVINVSKKRGGALFTDDDLRVLSTLANQSALVLRKIELWDNLQEQVVQLEKALSELKQTQSELVQSEKLASIGQLAGGMAHEINNPLQVIRGRIELLFNRIGVDPASARDLETVLKHVDRIADIVSGLLRFARRRPEGESQAFSVDDAIRETLAVLGNHLKVGNIKLVTRLRSPRPCVLGSSVKMQQVFTNIILNAQQAMEGVGGELSIQTSESHGCVSVSISDTGPGIGEEHLPHVFEPFFTTKPEGRGTGLGLSVTYGIVQSHGGQIEVKSREGEGTTFIITLPIRTDLEMAA